MSLSRNARLLAVGLSLALFALLLPSAAFAQDPDHPPKVDIFIGYQWLNPGGTVPSRTQPIVANPLQDIPQGVGLTGAYNFNKWWALEADYGGNWNKVGNETTTSFGPRLTYRTEGLNLFGHTLLGLNRFTQEGLPPSNGIGAILGGGMDIPIWKRLTFRLIEADYVWARHSYAQLVGPDRPELRRPTFEGARLRSGIVLNFGLEPPAPVAATCSVKPTEVMVGEPVTATVSASNFNPKHDVTYEWSSTGGKVSGTAATAQIDTNGLTGGSYTVTAKATDAKAKKNNMATCTASFTVKEPPKNPPTMSCSANPATVQTGTASTITCTCTSPDNVSTQVSGWNASAGSISGSGNTATLNTTGAPAGPITVSATCTDSRGLTGQSSATVTIENPPPPPAPKASKLSSCDFSKMAKIKKPWRVDNECKAILDDVAKNLQQNPDSKLVVVGNADPKEKRKNLAAERALNVKSYLTAGEAQQHIDASRIETRTSTEGGMTSEHWVVPSGASFDEPGTTAVDESKIKAVPDHPSRGKKKAAKPKAQ